MYCDKDFYREIKKAIDENDPNEAEYWANRLAAWFQEERLRPLEKWLEEAEEIKGYLQEQVGILQQNDKEIRNAALEEAALAIRNKHHDHCDCANDCAEIIRSLKKE